MKKVLKVLVILSIFFLTIVIFVTVDTSIMINSHNNDIEHECAQYCGLGIAFSPIVSTWKFAFLMTILAIWAKFSKKLDITTKNTIYFFPIISFWSFFILANPILWLMELIYK